MRFENPMVIFKKLGPLRSHQNFAWTECREQNLFRGISCSDNILL